MSICENSMREPTVPAPPLPETELTSDTLFDGAKTIAILHGGERYLLRITRQNKLILTK